MSNAVAAWGVNDRGQLGAGWRGPTERLPVPGAVLGDVLALEAGDHFTLALTHDERLLVVGGGAFGQRGDGTRNSSSVPGYVKGLSGVRAMAADGAHAMALLADGHVATWGGNAFKETGNGTGGGGKDGPATLTPAHLPLEDVVAVACGGGANYALTGGGELYGMGANYQGQLGPGPTEVGTPQLVREGVMAVAAGGLAQTGFVVAMMADGSLSAWGGAEFGETDVRELSDVRWIVAGAHNFLALHADGSVTSRGSDIHGQNAVGGLTGATAIAVGTGFALVAADGKLYGAGNNTYGTLGDGGGGDRLTVVETSGVANVSQIAAGTEHALALVPAGAAPLAPLTATPGPGSLTVEWRGTDPAKAWTVGLRKAGAGAWQSLHPAKAVRNHVFTGLAAQPYEVLVQSDTFSPKIVTATPL